jgi:hypothetical protein
MAKTKDVICVESFSYAALTIPAGAVLADDNAAYIAYGEHFIDVVLGETPQQTEARISLAQDAIEVPDAVVSLGVTAPGSAKANVAILVTVKALDDDGRVNPAYRGTVAFTSNDASAVLPANYPFVQADKGVHVFNVTMVTVATKTVTATDTVTAGINGTTASIVVGA